MAEASDRRPILRWLAAALISGVAAVAVAFGRSTLGADRVIVIVSAAVVLNTLLLVDCLRIRLRD